MSPSPMLARALAPSGLACEPLVRGCAHPWDVGGRVPPHDLDAEAAVLSTLLCMSRSESSRCSLACECDRCLTDDALVEGVFAELRREHFYSDANGRIYEAARECAFRGESDIVIVAAWLREAGRLAQVGGATYLAQLANATPAVAHVGAHVAIVRELHALRTLIATCQRIAAEGYGATGPVDVFIAGAVEAVSACAELLGEVAPREPRSAPFEVAWPSGGRS